MNIGKHKSAHYATQHIFLPCSLNCVIETISIAGGGGGRVGGSLKRKCKSSQNKRPVSARASQYINLAKRHPTKHAMNLHICLPACLMSHFLAKQIVFMPLNSHNVIRGMKREAIPWRSEVEAGDFLLHVWLTSSLCNMNRRKYFVVN
jgi:hypothetical protein